VHLLVVLEQPGPELLLELLLAQHKLDVTASVVNLGLLGVDLGVKLELERICDLLGC
jgi:hypothetical protein